MAGTSQKEGIRPPTSSLLSLRDLPFPPKPRSHTTRRQEGTRGMDRVPFGSLFGTGIGLSCRKSDPVRPSPFEEFAPMRKMFLSLAALALVASPAFAGAGKYNSVVAPGDPAPAFS